jgi:serine/threonine protein kinase
MADDAFDGEMTVPVLHAGRRVFHERYELREEVGRGAMGVVWRAHDLKLQVEVALKFLPRLVVRDGEAMEELAAETRRCLTLTHPHIVRVYTLEDERPLAAISMEYCRATPWRGARSRSRACASSRHRSGPGSSN